MCPGMFFIRWKIIYKLPNTKLGLAMYQWKKLRITMINFFSFYSIKLFPHVTTGKVFFYTDQTTCHEGHSQPTTVWKNTEINTVSVMHETGRNMHFYSDICTQTNCICSNQHASARLSNYHLS